MTAAASLHPKYRTKLCRNLASGSCPYGDKCSFIHPDTAPGIIPYSLLSQQLVDWSVCLPRLLALSAQKAPLKNMSPCSPPRSQEPQLVDQDPSPPTSLLLSESDASPSDHMPQKRRSDRRKKYPCRHFLRTGGWCPAGTKCKFHHDVTALPSAALQKAERSSPSEKSAQGRTISGGVLISAQASSPPIVPHKSPQCAEVQPVPSCSPPRYPYSIPTIPNGSDQPMHWPDSTWQGYPPYYATVPPMTTVPAPPVATQTSLVQHSVYPPPQAQARTAPQTETQNSLPAGAYEVNGTTYFTPTTMPSAPAPPPVTYPVPSQPALYGHPVPVPPPYPYYAPPVLPAGYYGISNQTADVRLQTSFDPFGSEPMMPRELPIDDFPLTVSSSPSTLALTNLILKSATDEDAVTRELEFPYRPPKHQRAGHARRISINIKKHDRSNSS